MNFTLLLFLPAIRMTWLDPWPQYKGPETWTESIAGVRYCACAPAPCDITARTAFPLPLRARAAGPIIVVLTFIWGNEGTRT